MCHRVGRRDARGGGGDRRGVGAGAARGPASRPRRSLAGVRVERLRQRHLPRRRRPRRAPPATRCSRSTCWPTSSSGCRRSGPRSRCPCRSLCASGTPPRPTRIPGRSWPGCRDRSSSTTRWAPAGRRSWATRSGSCTGSTCPTMPRGAPIEVGRWPIERRRSSTAPPGSASADALDAWADWSAAPPSGRTVWLHADLHPRNVLSRDGRLAGLLDWGDLCAGDPANDLDAPWLLLPVEHHDAFWAAYGAIDHATEVRARSWALYIAVTLIDAGIGGRPRLRGHGPGRVGPPAALTLRRSGACGR